MPNTEEIAMIEDPPRLKSGNGSPVSGIKPKTVKTLINIWIKIRIINPDNKYFSKIKLDLLMSSRILIAKKNQSMNKTKHPKKPKFFEKAEKIKSVVWTGTNTETLSVIDWPVIPPSEICSLAWLWEKSWELE